jgi:hypothetical protein
MESSDRSKPSGNQQAPLIIFDSAGSSGVDITTASPTDRIMAEELPETQNVELRRPTADSKSISPLTQISMTSRPPLRRETSAPPPPQQPPPPAPSHANMETPTDSLSLMQLKKIVTEMPKLEPIAYAFGYTDTQALPDELNEWFQYSEQDQFMILSAKASFDDKWAEFQSKSEHSWTEVDDSQRRAFLIQTKNGLGSADLSDRVINLEVIAYLLAGAWGSTAGLEPGHESSLVDPHVSDPEFRSISPQLHWISRNATLIQEHVGLQVIFQYLRKMFENEESVTLT